MSDIMNFDDVVVDNTQPECFPPVDFPEPLPVVPEPPCPAANYKIINPPYSDQPYPPKPAIQRPDVPGSVPNTYIAPGPIPPPPHRRHCAPMHWDEDERYVTKCQLNRILRSIADADIFKDLSTDGTTITVGGIKKGTKLNNLTFAQFVAKLLYPTTLADDDVYACETPDGKTVLNSTVVNAYGDLKAGDSLNGMTISQILEAMLCGKNNWGTYSWVSDPYTVTAASTMIDAEVVFPEFVAGYNPASTYELHVICLATNVSDKTTWVYDQIIALKDSKQVTNVDIEGVPADIKWSYNPESKKITLHTDTETTVDIAVVLLKR